MRLEIVIPDSTEPDLKVRISNLTKQLTVNPESIKDLAPELPAAIPDYLGILDRAQASPNRFKSREEVDAYLRELRSEW
jgi:hypothetical protein